SVLLIAGMVVGCSQEPATNRFGPIAKEITIDGTKYRAETEPAEAKSVIDTRKDAKDGDEVTVVGRVGGSKRPVVQGRAAFTIIDLSLKACGDDPNCFDFA